MRGSEVLTQSVLPFIGPARAVTLICIALGAHRVGATDLVDAVAARDYVTAQALLEDGADVDGAAADGARAIHWAVYNEDAEAVDLLISTGADVTLANRDGATPLMLAAVNGNVELVDRLLNAGADANATFRNGETMLMMAARTGNADVIERLVAGGAAIDARELLRGTTALMWAAAYSNPDAVAALLEAGADHAARSDVIARGRRPYLAPSAKSRIESYRRGVGQAGRSIIVDLDGDDDTGFSDDEFLADEDAGLEETDAADAAGGDDTTGFFRGEQPRDWGGLTALVFAAREGDLESVRLLVEAGADINQTTEYGWTPLLTATQNRYYTLGRYLLENGADPNIANNGGWNALYLATDNRNIEGGDYPTRKPDMDHLEFIRLLLDAGADPNLRMASSTETRTIFTHQWLFEEGATPFLRAAQSSDLELMHLLLEHGAGPLIATRDNVTPLMVAAGIGWVEGVTFEWSEDANVETVRWLLEHGADPNARDTLDGRTALMGAAHKGRNAVVRMLVDAGADLGARDIGSRDSIHQLAGVTWQAIDYADGLVRVGVQSAIAHPETAALIRELMLEAGLEVPPEGRTLDSICVVDLCR